MMLTVQSAAKRVKRTVRTIDRWIASGELKSFMVNGVRWVRERDLLALWRTKQRRGPEGVKHHLVKKYDTTE